MVDAGKAVEPDLIGYGFHSVAGGSVNPNTDLPFLPRIGLQMPLPGGYERFTWYGRGPLETYCDRQEGGQVGVYLGDGDGNAVVERQRSSFYDRRPVESHTYLRTETAGRDYP
jgi:hypothetical protein